MPTVLVIDDDPALTRILTDVLRRHGHHPLTADSGQAAVALMEGPGRPDLILLDLNMPGLDGPGFRSAQRAHPRWAQVPVVVVSAEAVGSDMAWHLDAADFVAKPFASRELMATIDRVLARGA
jgi:DNA-binding response OmpR family regulator